MSSTSDITPPPRPTAGARADVSINPGDNRRAAKATVSVGRDEGGFHWPRDVDEWNSFASKAVPWVAGLAIILAASASYQKNKCEHEKDEMTYGALTKRKASRGKDTTGDKWEETKGEARRGWFGFKRNAHEVADEAESTWDDTKKKANRKANEAAGYAKDKVDDVKTAGSQARGWASEKAHDAADATRSVVKGTVDATKSSAYKTEHAVGAAGSAAIAGASAAEEKTGRAMKEAGKTLEEDGRSQKRYWRGEEVKQETKKKGICTIM